MTTKKQGRISTKFKGGKIFNIYNVYPCHPVPNEEYYERHCTKNKFFMKDIVPDYCTLHKMENIMNNTVPADWAEPGVVLVQHLPAGERSGGSRRQKQSTGNLFTGNMRRQ